MGIISYFRKKRAIKIYLKSLSPLLGEDHAIQVNYTPEQINSTLSRHRLPMAHASYAMAMFSTEKEFNHYHQEVGENCDFKIMRNETIEYHFKNIQRTKGGFRDNTGGHDEGVIGSDFGSGGDSD